MERGRTTLTPTLRYESGEARDIVLMTAMEERTNRLPEVLAWLGAQSPGL
jgi:hypothetical protein